MDVFGPKSFILQMFHLRVEDKVFRRAGVLAVDRGGGVDAGHGDVQDSGHRLVQSVDVLGQRARHLELLDYHLRKQTTC